MFTIMGIDPGTRFLGAATLKVNLQEPKPFILTYADTLRGDLNEFHIREDDLHQNKAKGLVRAYAYLLEYLEPDAVCCEDNFLELSPSSFKRLIEVVTMMSYCTLTNRPNVPFHLALPRLAKQIVHVDFQGSTKDHVKEGLMACELLDLNAFDLNTLSEHANDAILLALYEAVQLYKSYGWIVKNDNEKKYSLKT